MDKLNYERQADRFWRFHIKGAEFIQNNSDVANEFVEPVAAICAGFHTKVQMSDDNLTILAEFMALVFSVGVCAGGAIFDDKVREQLLNFEEGQYEDKE